MTGGLVFMIEAKPHCSPTIRQPLAGAGCINRRFVNFISLTTRLLICPLRILAVLTVAICSHPRAEANAAERPVINAFLFAGQSNMAGADAVVTTPPGFEPTAADHATRLTTAPLPEGEQSPLYLPWGELRAQRSKDQLVHGPEVGFARALYAAGWRDVAIIKVYANFSRNAPTWPWAEGGSLFHPWMQFIDSRLAELRAQGYPIRIGGIIWHQGIDDAIHGPLAIHYADNLRNLIDLLRLRYGTSTTPFVLARSVNSSIARAITGNGDDAPMATVRRAQITVGASVAAAAWIDVDDLPNVNTHHFSAANQLVIGGRFGAAFLKLSQPRAPVPR